MSSGNGWVKEREFKFNGDPVTFKRFLDRFTNMRFALVKFAGERWYYHYNEEGDSVYVAFWPPDKVKAGWGEAIPAPGGKAFIRVYAKPKEWPSVRGAWELLEEDLRRQGWLEGGDTPGAVANELANREPTEREKKKLYVLSKIKANSNMTAIANKHPYYMHYNTVRMFRDELIEKGDLPAEFKKPRKRVRKDSI